MMMGFGGPWMTLWMVIFWVVVVGLALWVLSRLFPGTREQVSKAQGTATGGSRRALDILNERYARGEITRSEYHWRLGNVNRTVDQSEDSALAVLKERYAKGEIDKEQYERMRGDLLA